MPLDLSDEALGLPSKGNGLDLSDESLGLPAVKVKRPVTGVLPGPLGVLQQQLAPELTEEILAAMEGIYSMSAASFAAIRGTAMGAAVSATNFFQRNKHGLSFGETFREEFDSLSEHAADMYKPLAPEGETLVHKAGELLTRGVQSVGDFAFEAPQLSTPLGLFREPGQPLITRGEPSPLAGAAAQTATVAALFLIPTGRHKPGGTPPPPTPGKGPTGWEAFATKYPEAAKSLDASSLGTVRYERPDRSIMDAVTRQMDTELGLSGDATKLPFRTKATMVFDKTAPNVPLSEKLQAVQAMEKKITELDAARLSLSQRRGLPPPSDSGVFNETLAVTVEGQAITPKQARQLATEFKKKTVEQRAEDMGLSVMGQLKKQYKNVEKHAEGTPERNMEMSALERMWRSAFPDEVLGKRSEAFDSFLNFKGDMTFGQVMQKLGPQAGKEGRFWQSVEARRQRGIIDIEGMEYLLNSFKDLPDKPILKRSTIVGQLNRQGVPEAEKQAVLRALRDKDTITQAELVGSVAADILPLKAREIQQKMEWEDVVGSGLERLGVRGEEAIQARVWEMPFEHTIENHFNEISKAYFAHTRGFDKPAGGPTATRHIAEIQSDLAQQAKGVHEFVVDAGGPKEDIAAARAAIPLEKRWYERILMEENRQASKDGVAKMRMATADTTAKVQYWIRAPGEKLKPEHQGIYNFYKNEVASFARSRFGAREVADEFNNTWLEWAVDPADASKKIPAFGGRQRGIIDVPEWGDVQAQRTAEAGEKATTRGWATPAAADDKLHAKVQAAFEKSRAAEAEGHKVTLAGTLRRAREEVVAHDYDLRAELERAGEYGQKSVDRMALQNGATMAAKSRMDAINDRIFNTLNQDEKLQVDDLMRLRRVIEIDSYKGVGKHKHPEDITGPEAEAEAIRMRRDLGDVQFSRIYGVTDAIMKEYKDILNRRLESGLLSEESYLKLLHFDYSPTVFINLIDPIQTFTVRGQKISVRTSGVPFLERGKRGAAMMDSQLLLAEAIVRSENLIFKNNTLKQLHELATKASKNADVDIVRLPPKGAVGKEGTPDAYMKHTPKGWAALGVRFEGRQDFVLMREDMAEQFIRRPQIMSETLGTVARWGSGSALVKATATTYNPFFIFAGLPMDVLHVWLATSKQYSRHLPVYAGQMAADLAATARDAWARGPQYQQALREGLGSSFMTHEGRGFTGITSKTTSIAERQMMPRFDKLKGALSYVNESADIWVRMAHRNRLMTQGIESWQATGIARNRLDYSAGGEVAKAIDTVVPYTNVAVQAPAKVIKAGAKDKGELVTKLAWLGGTVSAWTLANMISSPETWQQIPTSTKIRWLPITFGDQWYIMDADGNKRYVYFNGVRLDATAAPLAATIISGLELAEYGKAPDDIMVRAGQSLNPVFEFTFPPAVEAIRTYMSNYDAYTGRPVTPHFGQVKPENEGLTYGRGEPPSLISRAVGGATGMSPPRLDAAARKVMNTNNPYLQAMGWGLKELFEGSDPRMQAQATEEIFLKNPFVRPFVRLTNPSSQYLQDVGERRMEEGSRRKQMTDSVDDLLFQVRHGQAGLADVKTYVNNQPPEDREWLGRYTVTTHNVKEIMKRFMASENIPNETWWRAVATLPARPRAQEFYSQWLSTDADGRQRMERIARALHNKGAGFYSDDFKRELARERSLLGTEQR